MPLGADLNLSQRLTTVTSINKDFLLIEVVPQPQTDEEPVRSPSFSHFSTYEPEKEAKKLTTYPVTWTVDQNHTVKQLSANEERVECLSCRGEKSEDGRRDEL